MAQARIGVLAWSSCDPGEIERLFGPFLLGMADLGHRPGETFGIECRSAGGRYEGLRTAAVELAELPVDVIVSNNQPAGQAARAATGAIPIVTIFSGDPVATGLAESIARPGGNLTGVTYYATELTAKRLELLKEMLPGLAVVGVLANPNLSYLPFEADTRLAAERLGIVPRIHFASAAEDLEDVFAGMAAEGVQAVFVLPDLMFATEAPGIAALALRHGLPGMAWGDWFVGSGLLMAYSTDYGVLSRRLAFYVDRILKGANPGDLPIEQPTSYHLTVNLATAGALSIEVPQSLLLLAESVIE